MLKIGVVWKKMEKNGKNFRKTIAIRLIIVYNNRRKDAKEGAL